MLRSLKWYGRKSGARLEQSVTICRHVKARFLFLQPVFLRVGPLPCPVRDGRMRLFVFTAHGDKTTKWLAGAFVQSDFRRR